ncbi:hypothetical protein GGI43DRAFT_97313 [Trichoderma evansii]
MAWHDSPEGLSPDWVFSNNSNVHVCNDRRETLLLALERSTCPSKKIPILEDPEPITFFVSQTCFTYLLTYVTLSAHQYSKLYPASSSIA